MEVTAVQGSSDVTAGPGARGRRLHGPGHLPACPRAIFCILLRRWLDLLIPG